MQLRWSSLTGTPSRVWSLNETLSVAQKEDTETAARRFLNDNADLFRLRPDEVNELRLVRRDQSPHNGTTHLTLQQQVNGIEVFQSEFAIHLDRHGSIIATSGELIPGASARINPARPLLAATEALKLAAREADTEITAPVKSALWKNNANARQMLDQPAAFSRSVEARLVWFPVAADQLRLGWQFTLWMRETPDVYLMVIDAERGSLLYRYNLTNYEDPHGLVYNGESPRPNLPRSSDQPATVVREDLPFTATAYNGKEIFPAGDPHRDWWAGKAADALTSNNADVALDLNGDDVPDQPRLEIIQGNLSFPLIQPLEPVAISFQSAAQVNLFYWMNRWHDILYSCGFTEEAGNFQASNFGRSGFASDAIQADVQDGSGTNNANFTTPPDGESGRVQLYLWSGNPQLDSSFDQTVVLHELTHGLSNRLIGNATGLAGMQAGAMGEGWSDFFALALLAKEGDDPAAAWPIAQYVSNNYQRGLRRYPSSTNLAINPLTFGKLAGNSEIHAAGEIWCSALWELRAALIQKYGFSEGQRQSLQLIVDGMKLTPRNPTFIDARNAILLADRVNNGSASQCLLWQCFARRGLGYSAETLDVSDAAPREAFDTVPACSDSGTITLNKSSFLNGESVQITLADRNAIAPVSVHLASSVTGDKETITLSPDVEAPGTFRGAVRVVAGQARPGDGELQASIEAGDQLIASYDDTASANGSLVEVKTSAMVAREKTIFEDTVEQGNQGWIATGSWGITSARSVSHSHCWTDSPDGNYPNGSDTTLTSPLFDLSGINEVTLTMAHSFLLDQGLDSAIVEYSNNDGATWLRATAFTGTQAAFRQERIRLRGLDGQARGRLRFRLQSDAKENADGWYLDDIQLTGRSTNPSIISSDSENAPQLAAISPAFGAPAGGTAVTISGQNFTESADTVMTFDGLPALAVNVLSATTIKAITPPHSSGTVNVRISNRNGEAVLADGFTYFSGGNGEAPLLASLSPNSGSLRGGTVVTLFGANFTPETVVTFGTQKSLVTFINAHTLRVTTPAANASGLVDVMTSNGNQTAKLAAAFTYRNSTPPVVTVTSPGHGEVIAAGSAVNITWQSSADQGIVRHRIALCREAGTSVEVVYEIAADVSGAAQSFAWAIPSDLPLLDRARLRVSAIDADGTETAAFSTGFFALTRRWENAAQLPVTMQEFAVVSDGKFLYTVGGRANGEAATALDSLLRVDPNATRAIWRSTSLAPMPVGECGANAVYLNGRIYVPGGLSAKNQVLIRHQVYDIAANSWDQATDVPVAMTNFATTADEERGVYYVTGGTEASSLNMPVSKVRRFDPASNRWSELPPMNEARYGHEAALIDGRLYVAGGSGSSGVLTSGEVYDFSTGQWTAIAPLNHSRVFAQSATGTDTEGNPLWFLIGGWDSSQTLPRVEVYDLRHNRWLVLDDSFNLPTPRAWLGGATLGGYFYAVGGFVMAQVSGGGRLLISQRVNERMRVDGVIPISLNQAPVLAVPEAQIAVPGNETSFNVSANDLGSGVPVTMTANNLPPGAVFETHTATNNSAQGTLRWKATKADVGQVFTISFTASDGQISETKLVRVRVIEAQRLSAVNAADFSEGTLAADSIAAVFGTDLATSAQFAQTLPLPLELGGTRLTINGIATQLLFVSPTQINFIVPANVEIGTANIVVTSQAGAISFSTVKIATAAPGLFTNDATGRGDAAATATPDGVTYQVAPFDVLVNNRPNNLVLYGTGLRRAVATKQNNQIGLADLVTITIDGQPARVIYAGAQGQFSGLDQINLELPPKLAGSGERRVEIVLSVNGVKANRVTVQIR